ncbi:spindle and centriole-associated protein 1 isoform X1 [Polypterus senegalus]|uniref:spindle and centriole-associated protein 1 isoform X1 n=2 Tax=Polypterus senegalus TaxID=55291 RepID=UPI0019627BDC|nr:spindle and centriole-associated protein 1 isoform X1 [Polypterus senegalus]
MSFIKINRSYYPHGFGKKNVKTKKRAAPKQEWVNTMTDLSVHRATPEEMQWRHEIHKSKNKAAAQWELREKTLKRKQRRIRTTSPDSLESAKLSILREVFSQQYQMHDVLEKSDRAMAVVKDLFGDDPKRQTGFPNVTIAPNCAMNSSMPPVMSKRDCPTQLSILSESVMDSQALNEIANDSHDQCDSEYSKDEEDSERPAGKYFESNIDMRRHCFQRNEQSFLHDPGNEYSGCPPSDSVVVNPSETPHTPLLSSLNTGEMLSALNATSAVKRVRSRWFNDDEKRSLPNGLSSTATSEMFNQVLNPNLQNKRKGKKCLSSLYSSKSCTGSQHIDGTIMNGNVSSLDMLQHMMGEVDRELCDIERRNSPDIPSDVQQGLTGFSMSLVYTLRRLVHHLKELKQEARERETLSQRTEEQRMLIDAMTAEMLSIREENIAIQARFQEQMSSMSEQLTSLKEELKKFTGNSSVKSLHIAEEKPFPIPKTDIQDSPEVDVNSLRNATDYQFQPAVLLSPPQQKDSPKMHANRSEKKVFAAGKPNGILPLQTEQALIQEQYSKAGQDWVEMHPKDLQMRCFKPYEDLETVSSDSSYSCLPQKDHTQKLGHMQNGAMMSQAGVQNFEAVPNSVAHEHESLLSNIAALSLQNSTIRAQLDLFQPVSGTFEATTRTGTQTSAEHSSQAKNRMFQKEKVVLPAASILSMEQRIAELNRQSNEARAKLLELNEQKKRISACSVSPPLSPIPPTYWVSEDAFKSLDVSIPLTNLDSAATPMPSLSITSDRSTRPASSLTKSHSPNFSVEDGRAPLGPKVENLKGGPWFALPAHIE